MTLYPKYPSLHLHTVAHCPIFLHFKPLRGVQITVPVEAISPKACAFHFHNSYAGTSEISIGGSGFLFTASNADIKV